MLRRLSKRSKQSDETKETRKLLMKFLEFISSSIWSIPIASFIEQQSIVFDRQQMETEIYEQIHKEYASLIDTLIECFCEDIETTPQMLTESIKLLDQENLSVKQRVSLEPLAAAQDLNVFVPMMMRKNVELQLQALQMIEYMCGLIPNVLQLEDGETLRNKKKLSPEDTERYVLISVLRQSKQEFEAMHTGRPEMEFVAREGQQQRERLEGQILREEKLLQKALYNGKNNVGTTTDEETPLSVAAVMISHIATNTDDESSSSTGVKETRDAEMITENLAKSSIRSSSQTGVSRKESTSAKGSRPGTATRQRTSITGEKQRKNSVQMELVDNNMKTESRPRSVKQTRPSLQMDEILSASKDIQIQNEPSRKSSLCDSETNTEPDLRQKSSKPESRRGSRPTTRSRKNSEEMSDVGTVSRPHSRHTSRKELDDKSEDRPATRRSSVDKNAPKRKDSIPNERRSHIRDSQKETDMNKPPKHPGGVRVPRYPEEEAEERRISETPGMEHGPRRKNLGDVHSHLVDRDRLNSSDVRARAEYLREQRDRLLQLKREERIRQMNEATKSEPERPKTAKAARGLLEKKEEEDVRKEISRKLKTEILTIN